MVKIFTILGVLVLAFVLELTIENVDAYQLNEFSTSTTRCTKFQIANKTCYRKSPKKEINPRNCGENQRYSPISDSCISVPPIKRSSRRLTRVRGKKRLLAPFKNTKNIEYEVNTIKAEEYYNDDSFPSIDTRPPSTLSESTPNMSSYKILNYIPRQTGVVVNDVFIPSGKPGTRPNTYTSDTHGICGYVKCKSNEMVSKNCRCISKHYTSPMMAYASYEGETHEGHEVEGDYSSYYSSYGAGVLEGQSYVESDGIDLFLIY